MKRNFRNALKLVLQHEGGWADHPRDPGGATMKGVTLAVYQSYFGVDKGKDDLRNISDQELAQIYSDGYWDKCLCDELPKGVDYAVFDAAVNSGPGRSARWLQGAVGAQQDGTIGPRTLTRVSESSPTTIINAMCELRLGFLRGLSTWSDFGRGWEQRVGQVRAEATAMSGNVLQAPPPATPTYRIVKRGSSGKWVSKLQQALGLHVDGKFGPVTETALIDWQRENGLTADGIAGRNTYRALGLIG